ncbi:Hypothetical protein Ccan_19580 [Capnocytophaga canimorsus Cc5]|uniref:Uncharacterized protein n=1 Tax=Capnocytophaga canimorsus (strain 5) TaxID=860228 RepID=F9YTM9_CAPCC|nr:hypothetical protein [Capnocytophaga canimorsus]AEK24074.1 Hypothetical protein Ccan_19580 [Capnocytophaga canimorsus Cc5]
MKRFLRILFLTIGWGVPILSFLEFFLNAVFKIEMIFYSNYLIVLILIWVIAGLGSLIFLLKKRLKIFIFLVISVLHLLLFYHWSSQYQFSFQKNVEGTDYTMKIFMHHYEVWQMNWIYRQQMLVKESDIFFNPYSKTGIAHFSKVNILSNHEEKIILEIEVGAKREILHIEKR